MKAGRKEKEKVTIITARNLIKGKIIECLVDETGIGWCQYLDSKKDKPIKQFSIIESEGFKDWIRVTLNNYCGEPKESWVEPLLKLFASEARRSRRQTLYLRTANIKDDWYFDLNETECLVISKGKISKIEAPTIFRRLPSQLPYNVDLTAKIEDINLLDKYNNFTDKWENELYKTTLSVRFVPGIAQPMELSRGPPGSGKTTHCRKTKTIIDPVRTMKRGAPFPKNQGDWFVNCRKNYALFFDNLNYLTKEQQDDCCRIVTGMDIEKRKLYTDTDTVAGTIQGILLINAIDLSNLNSDFIDRGFIWDLIRLSEGKRIPEEKYWVDFKKDLPKIMGAIFKILAKAQLIVRDVINIPDLRLKDFARYATACAIARGETPEEFAKQIKNKVELQKDETINQSEILSSVQKLMDNQDEWIGTASELLKELTKIEHGVIEGSGSFEKVIIRNVPKSWPQNASSLGKELSRVSFLFDRLGLECMRIKATKGIRKIKLKKKPESPVPPATQGDLSSINKGGRSAKTPSSSPPPPATQEAGDRRVAGKKNLLPPDYTDEDNTEVAGVAEDMESKITEEEVIE